MTQPQPQSTADAGDKKPVFNFDASAAIIADRINASGQPKVQVLSQILAMPPQRPGEGPSSVKQLMLAAYAKSIAPKQQ